jgi:RIO kinase 1
VRQHDVERAAPAWLTDGGTEDEVLGLLKTGKEAEVFIVERRTLDGSRSELLAHKRYRPTKVTHKGELQALGFSRARTFAHDAKYHEGRKFRYSREQRAVERMTDLGKRILAERWPGQEHDSLVVAHEAGVTVPYPVEFTGDGLLMQLIGDDDGVAAPRLVNARLKPDQLRVAYDQMVEDLGALTRTGTVHADLSPYNVLWWRDRLWMIDFPQAVDLLQNPHGFDLLHHDVTTMCTWFARKGVDCDGEALYAQILTDALP